MRMKPILLGLILLTVLMAPTASAQLPSPESVVAPFLNCVEPDPDQYPDYVYLALATIYGLCGIASDRIHVVSVFFCDTTQLCD